MAPHGSMATMAGDAFLYFSIFYFFFAPIFSPHKMAGVGRSTDGYQIARFVQRTNVQCIVITYFLWAFVACGYLFRYRIPILSHERWNNIHFSSATSNEWFSDFICIRFVCRAFSFVFSCLLCRLAAARNCFSAKYFFYKCFSRILRSVYRVFGVYATRARCKPFWLIFL